MKHEKQKMQSYREELVERMAQAVSGDGRREILPGVFLIRSSQSTEKTHFVINPAFCIIAQGSKEIFLGEKVFRYDPGHYLISTMELPVASQVIKASKQNPYFGFRLNLDASLVASVVMESGIEITKRNMNINAMGVSSIDANMLDAVVRLVRLLDTPDDARVLAPLIIREIIYRLLREDQMELLNHFLVSGADSNRIFRAIEHIRKHFYQPQRIEDIARELGMSVSGFHHHFKSVTAMSPLQFQKQIRLQEARRLMLSEDLDAANAGFRVGYEDPSYFSRDYKKLFGAPPQRDIAQLRSNHTK